MIQRDLQISGRTLHIYDTDPEKDERLPVVWHHGTPNVGAPPEPLFAAADRLGLRWVSFDRPGYGSSTIAQGRTISFVWRRLQMRSASTSSLSPVIPVVGLMRWGVQRF